jgi:hypothetical protein
MPNIKTINSMNEIILNDALAPVAKFNSINRIVDEKGNTVRSDYTGRTYKIVEKRERTLSGLERFGRGFLGTLAVVSTLCLALFSKSVRSLFTKSKETIRFAILEPSINKTIAATEIQGLFRGHLTQSAFKKQKVECDEKARQAQEAKRKAETLPPSERRGEALPPLEPSINKTIAATEIQGLFRGHLTQSAFKKQKVECDEKARQAQEAKRKAETLPPSEGRGEALPPSERKVETLPPSEFLKRVKENITLIQSEEVVQKLISIIKNEEVSEEEIRTFYAGVGEFVALQILFLTQTANSFNAVDEKIIEKALILETNFIQALNKKCPHRNPILRARIEQRTLGPSIFRYSMEEEEIRQIGTAFFEDLRKSGRLLTNREFVDQVRPREAYRSKGSDLGRILGANYIKRIADELGLKHIKVPKKIAVLGEGLTSMDVVVSHSNLNLFSEAVTIFAENITPLERGATREELTEFLKILEATGFGDFLGENFMLGRNQQGEEGIYFIDTEYANFRHIPFLENGVSGAIATLVQEEDVDWINQPNMFPRYTKANRARIQRYLELYGIEEPSLGNLLKVYVPEADRRTIPVKITYTVSAK